MVIVKRLIYDVKTGKEEIIEEDVELPKIEKVEEKDIIKELDELKKILIKKKMIE